ncbi:16S rRNA (uracil(1498)-N(3))-methyltransferase [Uliginosibacterium sp. H3]|uniref:Ribosomal RNA small subunit methyltransferase E n=1 Tax=Uliginosibacterium silvisoli TaxID=3114758 RepID=A0ABU6JYU3_9RHOO|nr:16S rRNA (uracil(1498)-N(3))-methyltransferase [Uliginosibacterium sp. H3]
MLPRFYCPMPLSVGAEVTLPREMAHHAGQVLRLREGDELVLFNGEGGEFRGSLQGAGRELRVSLQEYAAADRLAPLDVTLVQALAVADKMDWIVQKAAELGVRCVQPVSAERSVLKLAGDREAKRLAHWRQVAVSAAEQCGCNRPLQVGALQSLTGWLGRNVEAGAQRWILHPEEGQALSSLPRPAGPVALLIGPEGGWSPAEMAAAQRAGCLPVAMGPRVLRTETAGLAAMAAMLALWGDF